MANSYNSNPIILDSDTSSGWRSLQTLNVGNLPTTLQQAAPVTRQWGIKPYKVLLIANGTTVAGTVSVVDPIDGTNLIDPPIGVPAGQATGTVITREDFQQALPAWRDFKVSGLTATNTKLVIWYRS